MMRSLVAVVLLVTLAGCGGSKGVTTAPARSAAVAASPTVSAITFNAAKIPEGSDAYDVFMTQQGREMQIGRQAVTVARDGENFKMSGVISAPAMGLMGTYSHAFSAATLSGISYVANQQFQGVTFDANLAVANGRVTGSTQMPTPTGIKTLKVDSPSGSFLMLESDVLLALLPTVELSAGMEGDFQLLNHEAGLIKTAHISVSKPESVHVPAGTFDAFRIKVQQTGEKADTYWVSVAAPRKVVRSVQAESFDLRLAKPAQ